MCSREQMLIMDYLNWQNIPYQIETDLKVLMINSKGHMNPNKAIGFWLFPNSSEKVLVRDFYGAIDAVTKATSRYC